ncbi:hypothetical protein GOV04_03670 [Candidatus Woesearchaeota archaeon]|nr:hypothetical protein [Candidatus Woesearchaeota archaeon]
MTKKLISIVALLIVAILASSLATALPVVIEKVELNDDALDPNAVNDENIERGQSLEIEVKISSLVDLDDIEIEAVIKANKYNSRERLSDVTRTFDMVANRSYRKFLEFNLPEDVETDEYQLRIYISDRDGDEITQTYDIAVDEIDNLLAINDVTFNPSRTVTAGHALLTLVRVENMGEDDEEGVKITVNIPELAISGSDYIDEIESDDEITSEEIYFRIPTCATEGTYDVEVTVEYDKYEETTEVFAIDVVENDQCPASTTAPTTSEDAQKSLVTVGPASQEANIGVGAVYPVTITNAGSTSEQYSIEVTGADEWATVSINPYSATVLQSGQTEQLYVFVTPNKEAAMGTHMFAITVNAGEKSEQFVLSANVAKAQSSTFDNLKTGLEVGLVVLVVLLVVLGLIIGFRKMRSKEGDEEQKDLGQTYY